MRQTKYFQNLRIDGNRVISYTTNVATIDWWSVTTQKHINYVANTLGYNLIK